MVQFHIYVQPKKKSVLVYRVIGVSSLYLPFQDLEYHKVTFLSSVPSKMRGLHLNYILYKFLRKYKIILRVVF